MEKTFEERLCERLFRLDFESMIKEDLGDNVKITALNSSKDMFAEIKVECDSDFEDELAQYMNKLFVYGEYSKYLSALGHEWDAENHLLKIWIKEDMNAIEIIVKRKDLGTDISYTQSNGQISYTSASYGAPLDKIIGNIIMTELELNTEEEFSLKVEKL